MKIGALAKIEPAPRCPAMQIFILSKAMGAASFTIFMKGAGFV
jgi:hypothetical protein